MTSKEVSDAVGREGATSVKDRTAAELLEMKREGLSAARRRYSTAKLMRDEVAMSTESRLIDSLLQIIPELEREAAGEVEVTSRKAAEDRLVGIKRAAGSVRTALEEDDKRISEMETALHDANAKRTSRARKYEALQAEANGLTDRFDLSKVKLETLNEPPTIEVPVPWRHHMVRPSFERCEHQLRERRDYSEISGSEGYAIIMRTGLKPFRDLTAQEKEMLEDKSEVQKPGPEFARAVVEAEALGKLGVPGGGVFRG